MQYIFDNLDKLKESMPRKAWQDSSNNILLHTRGKGLKELLSEVRPNEPEDTIKYRLKHLYKFTREPFTKAVDAMSKSINSVGLSYRVQEDVEPIVKAKRVKTELGTYDIEQYLVSIFQQVIEYPNAHLVWLPISPEYNVDFEPLNHPLGLNNTTKKMDFEPYVATKIVYFDSDSCVWEHGDWDFMHEGKTKCAPYYMGCDLTGYYRSIPIGYKNGFLDYVVEPYYTPKGGFKLRHSRPLGGDLSSVFVGNNDKPYYESYFANAAEFGRNFISSYSDAIGVITKNNFPIRVFNDSICTTCNGKGTAHNNKDIACNDCAGSGKTFTLSPYNDVQRKSQGRRNEDKTQTPFVEYYSSGEGIMQFNIDYCFDTLFPRIEGALSLNYVRSAQSGTAKEEDKESYYALMTKLIKNYEELYEFSLESIVDLVVYDKSNRQGVEVFTQRSVRSANTFDLITQIGALSSSTVPSSMKAGIAKQYLSDIKSEKERKILSVIIDYDVLFGKSEADILQLSASVNNPITSQDMVFNLRGRTALAKLAEKYGDEFVGMDEQMLYNEAIASI
jgi:hypothetical protein